MYEYSLNAWFSEFIVLRYDDTCIICLTEIRKIRKKSDMVLDHQMLSVIVIILGIAGCLSGIFEYIPEGIRCFHVISDVSIFLSISIRHNTALNPLLPGTFI